MDDINKNAEGVNDRNFEAEREQIEERHRNEILNLLKGFEFERKDTEARFREKFEKKENELRNFPQGGDVDEKDGSFSNDVLRLEERSQEGENEQQVELENEKEELLLKITELEARLKNEGGNSESLAGASTGMGVCVSTQSEEEGGIENVNSNQDDDTQEEMQSSESNTRDMKSLSELQNENKKLEVDLNKSKDQILALKSEVKELTQSLHEIEKLFENDDLPSDKRNMLRQILAKDPRDNSLTNDVFAGPSNSAEDHGKSLDDIFTAVTADQPHRTNSMLNFQLEELNLENEDLKRSVSELETKLRRSVEENEIRVTVFNEKLNELVETFISDQSGESTKEDGFKLNLVEELNNIRLEKTSSEFLEEYVGIILRQKLTASSPDILDVNFSHELQSLEDVLNIEVFDGRVFDEEMKDEAKQVLRDKEKELLVAYTLEKLRDEIRHRGMVESTLEELQKERERDICANQAVNEVLKAHLGISEDGVGQDGDFDVNQAVNKVLREHLGMNENKDDKVPENNPIEVDSSENKSTSDIETLKAEKDNLERNLQELQDYFEKERQEWQEKLLSPLRGDQNDTEDKDKVIQGLHAQKVMMEQILNTERFHLSRLYYMEMKEELELCLKQQHQFDRSTKIEKERLVDAWKHHAEVGELYQEILSKETENIQNLQTNTRDEDTPVKGDLPNDSSLDELSQERSQIEQQLPVKLELLELQRRRCRDHKAASLILEQAVVAMETAAQEQEALLVSENHFRRKSSWSSVEDGEDSLDVLENASPQQDEADSKNKDASFAQKEDSSSYKEESFAYKEEPSPNSSADMVENPNRKDGLIDDLVKVFEKLLNGQQETNDSQLDSNTSDSELSEVESSSSRDVPSDDEGSIKKENSENLEDASSPTGSPRPGNTEPSTSEKPESHASETVDNAVPVIFKLPPRIENILTIERFNMSRLLRDEYVNKIRRGRQKLRRVRAKNNQKNDELVSKFQEEVRALLAGVEFGEGVEGERVVPQRQKLTATPSYDSGIADFVEQDKDEVVKKYKELLEKARRDLSRAHRALRARHGGGDEMKDELAKMKRSAKEAKNDLDELEEKQSDLEHERNALLEKIDDVQNFANESRDNESQVADSGQVSGIGKDDELPLKSDAKNHDQSGENPGDNVAGSSVAQQSQALLQNEVPANENNVTVGEHDSLKDPVPECEELEKKMDERVKEMENKIQKLSEEKSKAEEEVKDLQRKLVAGTGGEEILNDLQEKLTDANEEIAKLEEIRSALESEMLEKDARFDMAMKENEKEASELQRKLVSGTGGEDILKELQEKLEKANEEKSGIGEKFTGLEKEMKEKVQNLENEIRKMEEEIEAVQRKSVEGTGAEEIVAELQRKLSEEKAEKAKLEESCLELENEIGEKNKELKDVKECQQEEVNELQKKMLAGTAGEEILEKLQERLQEEKGKNFSLEEQNSDLQKEIKMKEKVFTDEKGKMEEEINELQKKLVSGTGGEEILAELQTKLEKSKDEKVELQTKCEDLEEKVKARDKELSAEIKEKENEIGELQKKLVSGTGGEEILAELQTKLEKSKDEKAELQTKCEELEETSKEKDKAFNDEIKEKENEINELQKKLFSGTGGEEILAELQTKLEKSKDEKAELQTKCEELEDTAKAKDKAYDDEIKEKENEINELQKKLVCGTGGEEILAELQTKLDKAKENEIKLEGKCLELEDTAKTKDKEISDEIKEKENEVIELQKKLVSGTGGEEILAELQTKLEHTKKNEADLETKCTKLEDTMKAKEKKFDDEIKEKENEINELQKKLVSGTGGEEILAELQTKLEKSKDEKAELQTKCEELEDTAKAKDKAFNDEIKEKENEINELQKKLVSGTGGEEILAELQTKLEKSKDEKAELQTKCEELEDTAKAKDKAYGDEIKEKENEINELQKKLVSGTGGEEILAELQTKLEKSKDEKAELQTKCEELEDTAKAKDKAYGDEIKEKENEINELQKKLVSGTGGEEILAELQTKLEKSKDEKAELQTKCEELEDTAKAKDKAYDDEIKEKENEINELQKKLVSGTGGEEILAELQTKLNKAKENEIKLEGKCLELEDTAKTKDKEISDEIKEKENEVIELQKKLVSGTGGEEILAELQTKLEHTKKNEADLETKCTKLEDTMKAKEKKFDDEIKEKENEINELQKKLVSGTGGEEILAELQTKLEKSKDEKAELQTKCEELEDTAKAKDKAYGDEIKEKENEINELQKKLVSGTGGEEILAELQTKLEKSKDEKAELPTKCEELEDTAKAKDKAYDDEIKEKENEINELQKKLVSGTGGEEILAELQTKLNKAKENEIKLEGKCLELEDTAKTKDKEISDEIKEKENEVIELQKKLVSGTGGEEILAELQTKLEHTKKNEADLETKCTILEDTVKAKEKKFGDEIKEKENEINELQKKLVSGTGGEEILAELQTKLEKSKDEKAELQTKCEELEDTAKAKDKAFNDEIKEKENEINELQRKLFNGTGGEEILAGLQTKLEKTKDEKAELQTKCEELEDTAKAKDKAFNDEIKEKENEINKLQKKLVSGTGGEEVLAELQTKLEKSKDENAELQTKCEELEDTAKAKDKAYNDEIKEKENEINELQKKLVSGSGGEEILAELQTKLDKAKENEIKLEGKCLELEVTAKTKDKEISDEIKEKENEVIELQKKLVSGTGGEEILAELQTKLEHTKKNEADLETKCTKLEDTVKAKEKKFGDEIKEKENEINELQKKLVSGTGGEEILAELQTKLEKSKDEKAELQTKCEELEDTAKAKDKACGDEIKEKENEINELQKKLVSGTGGEEILAELQTKLEKSKDEKAEFQTKCEELEDTAKAKDKAYGDEIKEKENEINELQKKLVSGTGGEEILAELQTKLEKSKDEKAEVQTKCEELADIAKAKDKAFNDEMKEKENEINELQKKLVSGTGGEEVLAELQTKLDKAKENEIKLEGKCLELEDTAKTKDKEISDEIKEKENEVIELQKKLVSGTGGEEILAELQTKLEHTKKNEADLETKCTKLEDTVKAKEKKFGDEIKEKENEINELQKKLVSGTGGEEILAELQTKLEKSKDEKAELQTKCEELEDTAKAKDKAYGDEIKEKENEINELQKKLVSGTGGEEILAELQTKVEKSKDEKAEFQTKCEELEDTAKAKDKAFNDEIKEKENEINELQKKLVSGTGGEEILAELQTKLEKTKDEKAELQTKCEELEDTAKAKDKAFNDEIKEKENEINELQKKLVSGTGGEEILAELQTKLEKSKDEKAELQTNCEELEDTAKAKDKAFNDEMKEKENEINELQKKLVSGTGGEEILAELQTKLDKSKDEKAELQKKCEELEDTAKAKDKACGDEIKEKENEINELQKKLVSGTGGEEILAELQTKLDNAKENEIKLEGKCLELEDTAKTKDKEISDEIKEKENEVIELKKKLVNGTGGEEILAELQTKLEHTKKNEADLETKCTKLEDMVKAKENKFGDEIKEKENEINELQKKLVSGTGGEEILAELQTKLEKSKDEKAEFQTKCEELEDTAKAKDKAYGDEIKEKENEINELQKKLVSGTGGEEILAELQTKLEKSKDEKAEFQTKCEELEDTAKAKDKAFNDEMKEKENEINELQKKLVSGTGGEEILAGLQTKLEKTKDEKAEFQTKCEELEDTAKAKDKAFNDEMKEKENEINELQKKLVSGTGGEEILAELQTKLEKSKDEKAELQTKCEELEDTAKAKDKAFNDEIKEKENEINELRKKLVSGTGGEEVLAELQTKLEKAKDENAELQTKCEELEDTAKTKDKAYGDEIKEKENEINELQKKLLSGIGGEEVLLDLQEKLNKVTEEKETSEFKVSELQRDIYNMDKKLTNQLNTKQKEIDKLQRDLVNATGAEDVLVDLEEKLAVSNKEIKKLEAKCSKLEKQKKKNYLDVDDGEKKLKKLEAANRILEKENEGKQEKIDELQLRMVQGTGGEGLLKELQNDLNQANERNKELEKRSAELEEDKNDLLSSKAVDGDTASLKEENERLEAVNENMVEKLDKLQKDLVNGTGSEELLEELQNEIKQLNSRNEELRKNDREKENTGSFTREGKDIKQLEKELNKVSFEKKRLNSENDKKEKEIVALQKKLVAGSGGEEILAGLQEKIESLKEENKNMAMQCHDVEEMKKDLLDEKEDNKKLQKELLSAKKENEKLLQENESKENEICELQKSIVNGSGAEEVVKTLQDKIGETTKRNKMLEKKCSDLERNVKRRGAVGTERDDKRRRQEVIDLAEAESEIKRLTQNCGEKDEKIGELQRKLVSGTGAEEILENLQDQVKGLQEKNSNLERKLAKTRKHEIAPKGLEKKEKEYGKQTDKNVAPRDSAVNQTEKGVSRENTDNSQAMDGSFAPEFSCDETNTVEEPSYEQCLQIIPQITEEKDHWREKYKALRMKVGEQFVDIIPEVWNEEAILEKEREEAVLQLSEIRQEISKKETPVMKAVSEKEQVETELMKVEDELGICRENLELLRDLAEEDELIEENEKKLAECLRELEPNLDSSQRSGTKDGKSSEVLEDDDMIRRGSETDALESKVSQLFNEMEELLAEEQNLENKQSLEKNIADLVAEKIDTENEIKEIESAINDLQSGLSSNIGAMSQTNQTKDINNELEKIQQEINLLQSSYETPSISSGQEVNNLLALMKEKSRLEDELTDTDKSLSQLGKRDYEALVKERETQEKVAKKLLELSREKKVAEGELQEVEALANKKENELQKSFTTELKSKEVLDTPSKKRRGFRKKKSSFELKSEDPGKVSSSEEGSFSEIDLGDAPLSSDATLALTKELGSLIQKKSSLAVRLEGMGKEMTAQSLKVEKSLLGVKDGPSEEPSSLGSSFTSIEDLTQSQMSLFDDLGMVDELSLATNVVKEERAKRKSSRKAPMAKLLKEKSTLEKRLKESQGKVLVQNTKIKNALGEGKDAEKAKEKFVQAVRERKAVGNELSNVCAKIDELASEEDSIKEKSPKKGKTPEKKSGKSLSKNDKRRLLSQRESQRQQLDNIKKKIENFSTDGEDAGLADFPEMREVGSIGNTVERLRELIAREAELKQDLDRLSRQEDPETLNGSLSGSSEGTGSMLDNDGELGKRDDKEVHVKDKTSGVPGEGNDEEEMPTEMLRQLRDRRESSSSMGEVHGFTTIPTGLLGKDSKIQKNKPVSSQVPSEQGSKIVATTSTPFSDLVDLLVKERARKEEKLRDLEKSIENEESGGDKNVEAARASKRKREDLKNKMEIAVNELEQRKAMLDESRDLLRKPNKDDSGPSEALLTEDYNALTEEKEELEKHLMAIKDELNMQTQSEDDLKDISAEYQAYKELKNREDNLEKTLDNINEKLRRRKEWAAMDSSERDGSTLAGSYEDVVKRMSEENLNMVDLIHELDETKETLSKEREITSELLDLIKSRVGDELLEALMREGLHSPSVEMREMGFLGGDGYQELLDKDDNDNVTVEELIGDYKKVNQFLYKENQKLHEKIESLKTKVDEDLFALIAEREPADVDVSKKREISKILENNKTLFQQIVTTNIQNEANDELLKIKESENKRLKIEMEDVMKEKAIEERKKFKEKVDNISIFLDGAKKREKELTKEFKKLEKDSSKEAFAFKDHETFTTEVGSSSVGSSSVHKELQNAENMTKEADESTLQEHGGICQEISSRLEEAEKLGSKVDIELDDLKDALAETRTETDLPESSVRTRWSKKGSGGLEMDLNEEHGNQDKASGINRDGRSHRKDSTVFRRDDEGLKRRGRLKDELKEDHGNVDEEIRTNEDDWGNYKDNEVFREDDEGLNRKISSVRNLRKAYAAKLDEVQELQQALKRNLDRKELDSEVKKMATKDSKLKEIDVENNALKKELARVETDNDSMQDELSNLEKENKEIKSKLKELKKKLDRIETENDSMKDELSNLEKQNIEVNSELKELKKELDRTQTDNDSMQDELSNLEKESKEINFKLKGLKKELDRTETENDSMKDELSNLEKQNKEINSELKELKKELDRIQTENDSVKDELSNLVQENKEIKSKIQEVETKNEGLRNDLELRRQVEDENNELKAKTQRLRDEMAESVVKLNEADAQKDAIVEKFENLQKEYKSIEEALGSVQKENSDLNEKVDGLKNNKEELSTNLNESQAARDEIVVVLANLEKERESLKETRSSLEQETDELKEKMLALQNENEEISARLKGEYENNKEMAKDVEDLKLENKSFEELLDLQKKENSNLQEETRELKNKNEEYFAKLNKADEKRKEIVEDLRNYEEKNKILVEKLGLLENDNKELNDKICALKNENEEVVVRLDETIVEKKKSEKSLQDLEKDNESLKETLDLLENENNKMIPKMDELEKVRKELEDEVDYLRKEEKDFETLNEKLKETETDRENVQEELEVLKRENKEVEDFVRDDLNQNIESGVKSALENYGGKCKETEEQNTFLKEEVETLSKLQSIVGETFSENLLDVSKDGLVLKDSQDNPKCLEKLAKDKTTLASILKEFEDDLNEVKQHLGEEVFSLIVNKDTRLDHKESETPLKIVAELKNGKHIKEIVKEYEDLIDCQAIDLENAEHLQRKGKLMEEELEVLRNQRDNTAEKAKTLGDELDVQNCEYQELLKKIIEHQTEIEEAEEMLREQRAKHEAEKENMTKQFNAEKTNMQRFINNERSSMEKAMQNLVNEIVRLKEERNEIRKSNRLEKEKLSTAFENERAEALLGNEVMKNEIQEKLERRFQDDLEEAKKEMQARQTGLEEELMKLRTERSDLVSKVAEIEDIKDATMGEENEKFLTSKERESKEQIKNEFEEKMNVEKKRFQETLNSLRQEIERLQNERRKAMNEISTTQEDQLKQTTDFSRSETRIYERLESEFRAKINSEKMIMESRIKELRKEKEVLNQQKQELKSSMRMERLETSKKHEREKEELAEKYRNELKTLRKNLEKSQANQEASSLPTQNFYELRRKIRDRDTTIKRYETFFKELNQEASILQRDSDMAV